MENYLTHHGIKGQRWGVRRFQDKNGKYTQAGLERYGKNEQKHNDAKNAYEKAKSDYKQGNASYTSVKKAKKSYESSKRRLKESYKSLKKDRLADEGAKLYKQGKTLTGNAFRTKTIMGVTGLAAAYVGFGSKKTHVLVNKYGSFNLNKIAAGTILVGSGTATALINRHSAKRLTAYYDRARRGYE